MVRFPVGVTVVVPPALKEILSIIVPGVKPEAAIKALLYTKTVLEQVASRHPFSVLVHTAIGIPTPVVELPPEDTPCTGLSSPTTILCAFKGSKRDSKQTKKKNKKR
jgi:hypothetical protein